MPNAGIAEHEQTGRRRESDPGGGGRDRSVRAHGGHSRGPQTAPIFAAPVAASAETDLILF